MTEYPHIHLFLGVALKFHGILQLSQSGPFIMQDVKWAIAFNTCTVRPPPPPPGGPMEFFRSMLKKMGLSLGTEWKNMEFFGGEALIFDKIFRGEQGKLPFHKISEVDLGCLQG